LSAALRAQQPPLCPGVGLPTAAESGTQPTQNSWLNAGSCSATQLCELKTLGLFFANPLFSQKNYARYSALFHRRNKNE